MSEFKDIQKRLAAIEQRNQRVEAAKAWETSWERKLSILILTYLVIGLYLLAVDNDRPWVNAIVPAVGFLLSTMAMTFAESIWLRNRRH